MGIQNYLHCGKSGFEENYSCIIIVVINLILLFVFTFSYESALDDMIDHMSSKFKLAPEKRHLLDPVSSHSDLDQDEYADDFEWQLLQ